MSRPSNTDGSFILDQEDRIFIDRLRGLSIIRVVLVHLGLSWFYPPYSQFVLVFLPILFFVSGAVSFPVFLRAHNWLHYAVKRLSSVMVPYYVIAATIALILPFFLSSEYSMTVERAVRWLLISPTSEMIPFSLGQLWFLRALLVISILSIPVYLIAERNADYLLVPTAVSIILAYFQTYSDVQKYFYVDFFNLYQPIVNAGFFFLGSYLFIKKGLMGTKTLTLLLMGSIAAAFFSYMDGGLTINMANHSYAPNLYYVGLSAAIIFIVLLAKPLIQKFLTYFRLIDYFVLLYSKHAYSVFIIHSILIYLSEALFGWEDVMARPGIAFAKIAFVMFGSLIISFPVTAITRRVSKGLLNSIYERRLKKPNVLDG